MPVIAQGKNEEELEKRLGAALLAGDTAVSIDNCDTTLEGAFLCQALTQQRLNIRILGQSRNAETPVNATIFANGNNLTIVGDLVRRTMMGAMDAQCEQPELRTFSVNIAKHAKAERGRLVTAALTVLRAWQVARGQDGILPPLGGFEHWSQRVREALVWLGCADPCTTIAKVRSNDPEYEALMAVIMQWRDHLGLSNSHKVQEVIERALNVRDFHNALLAVAESRGASGVISNDRLGRWQRKVEGRFVGKLRLSKDGRADGYSLWKLSDR